MNILNAFSIDVEDYFQVSAFEKYVDRKDWDSYPQRVVQNTQRILRLMDRHETSGTFYILGWVADKFPHLVREIHEAGHEVASHSYWHQLIYQLTPDQFREDLRRSRDVLQDITGCPVKSFRAPSFSITEKSLWALEILVEEGFKSDSSIFPIYHDRYGIPNARPDLHCIETKSGSIWELPPSVTRLAGINLPVSGGGYFRLYPESWSIRWLRKVNTTHKRPFVFYLHPWEVDPSQPRLGVASRASRFRHYVNLDKTEKKLERLLSEFSFGEVSRVIDQWADSVDPAVVAQADLVA